MKKIVRDSWRIIMQRFNEPHWESNDSIAFTIIMNGLKNIMIGTPISSNHSSSWFGTHFPNWSRIFTNPTTISGTTAAWVIDCSRRVSRHRSMVILQSCKPIARPNKKLNKNSLHEKNTKKVYSKIELRIEWGECKSNLKCAHR